MHVEVLGRAHSAAHAQALHLAAFDGQRLLQRLRVAKVCEVGRQRPVAQVSDDA